MVPRVGLLLRMICGTTLRGKTIREMTGWKKIRVFARAEIAMIWAYKKEE